MRFALTLAVLLASAGWVPARDEVVVAANGRVRGEVKLVDARDVPMGWRGARDRETGVVAQLWGSYVTVPGAVDDPAVAERAARAFVAQHLGLLAPGAVIGDLETITNRVDDGRAQRVRTIAFQQTWRGLRVVGGTIAVVFANDRLFAVTSQALPSVSATGTSATGTSATGTNATSAASATRAARVEAWIGQPVRVRPTGERVVLPIADDAGKLAYRIADVLDVASVRGGERWDVYVAPDGAPLLRESRVRHATGTVRYDAGVRRPGGARMAFPAAAANVTVDGTAQVTGDDGSVTWTGTAGAAVVTGLAGPLVEIVNQAGARASTTLTVAPDDAATWSAATDEPIDAQLGAFVHASIGKAQARRLFPSIATWLDTALEVFVNEPADCNASSADDGLHFHLAGPGCENTARLADVVYHELGHAVHRAALIPGEGAYQASLSEGLSDFFAANLNDDPGVGRGFYLDDAPLRDVDPDGYELVYPQDTTAAPHGTGLILAGALWDLRKTAGVALAETIYEGVVMRAPNLPGAYLAAQIADDDNGDLGDGTPHLCAIRAAFGKHGLADAAFVPTRVGVPVVDGTSITVAVDTPADAACPAPQVTGVTVEYRVDGGAPDMFALARAGATWSGAFPSLPPHVAVTYTVHAALDDQSTVIYPRNAADPRYQLFTGPVDEIWCERFDGDPGWVATGGDWQVASPPISTSSGDPTAAFTGALALGTQLAGDGRYEANATTSISTPAIDASRWGHVRLQYRRWLTVEDARYDHAELAVAGTTLWTNAESTAGTLDHVDREWRLHDLDVTAQAGAPLVITWSLASDDSRELGGWTIDDVCLVGYDALPAPDGVQADDDPGCCSAGGDPTSPLVLALLVGLLYLARRCSSAAPVRSVSARMPK